MIQGLEILKHLSCSGILVLIMFTSTRADIYCRSNQYYVPQIDKCLTCEMCSIGKETISTEAWGIEIKFKQGPTTCRQCVQCKQGTYSNVRAYQCKRCTVCSSLGKYEESSCTAQTDTVCTDNDVPVKTTELTVFNTTKKDRDYETTKENSRLIIHIVIPVISVTALVIIAIISFAVLVIRKGRQHSYEVEMEGRYRSVSSIEQGKEASGLLVRKVEEYEKVNEHQSERDTAV